MMSQYKKAQLLLLCGALFMYGCVSPPAPREPTPPEVREASVMIQKQELVIEVNEELLAAAFQGEAGKLKRLLDTVEADEQGEVRIENGLTALLLACVRGHTESVQVLLDAGVDVNGKTVRGGTPLMWAAGSSENSAETVRLLLDRGASVNARTTDGRTALMDAAMRGNTDTANVLLRAGAHIEERTEEGTTALMEASKHGNAETVQLLLDSGARVNAVDREGRTALTQAAAAGHAETERLLSQAGAVDFQEK
jgi:hypothetical protein